MTFREQLTITLIDKALFGALLALAVYLLNKSLERFKSERALANELAKQRIARIAEVWEALNIWQAEVIWHSRSVHKQIGRKRDDQDLTLAMEHHIPRLVDMSNRRAKEVLAQIDQSRFWLGEPLYQRFQNYYSDLLNHVALLLERPRSANAEDLIKSLDKSREAIFDLVASPAAPGVRSA